MASVRILGGDTERIQTPAVKSGALVALTGLSTVVVAIQRVSDGFWLDFADSTFKSSGWTTRQQTMAEVSATLAPGEYRYDWTAPAGDQTYMIRVDETGGTAKNVPFHGEIKVDQWVADLATSAELAALESHGDATWSTATGFATAAALAALESHGDATWSTATGFAVPGDAMTLTAGAISAVDAALTGSHGAGNWITADVSSLATSAALAALESHGDATWSTATGFATPGDAMTLTPGERATLTAAVDAALTVSHGAGSWTTAVVAGLATSAALAALESHGDATWSTATGFATSVELAALESHGDATWSTAIGFATLADVNAARDAILAEGGTGPWSEGSLSPTEALHLQEVWQRLHLDPANPRVDTPTSIKVPADGSLIDIQLAVVGTTITGTRQP